MSNRSTIAGGWQSGAASPGFDEKCSNIEHEIWSETRQIRAARGLSAMVAYDYAAKESILVPERWREIVTAYEVVAPTICRLTNSSRKPDFVRLVIYTDLKGCYASPASDLEGRSGRSALRANNQAPPEYVSPHKIPPIHSARFQFTKEHVSSWNKEQ